MKVKNNLYKKFSIFKKIVKTPTVLQMEAVECGAVALGIIMQYYGRIVPLLELRELCGVSRSGTNASKLLQAGRKHGLEAKGYRKNLEHLQKLSPPYIVFWNLNHFLVVEGFRGQKVYINDPASGRKTFSEQEFKEGYTGIVLTFKPGRDFRRRNYRRGLIFSLWSRLKNLTLPLLYSVLAGFFLTLVGMFIPVFSQVFVDEIVIQQREQWLRPLLLAMIIAALLQGALTLLRLRYLRRLKIKLAISLSSSFFWHILSLPVNFYAQRSAGEISSRNNLNNQVADVLSGKLVTTVIDGIMIVFYAILMSQYDLILTVIIIFFALINIFTLQWISQQRIDANQKSLQDYAKTTSISLVGLQNIETIKASGLESNIFSLWSRYHSQAINSQQELEITDQTLSVLPTFLSSLSSILLLTIGGLRVMDGHLSIGMLVAFQSMAGNFQQPINSLMSFGTSIQELKGNLIRLDDVLDNHIDPQIEQQKTEEKSQELFFSSKLQGYIEFRNLTFGYDSLERPLIDNFNLKVKPGQRIVLVGKSGSGKSTIAKLVSGLYQPRSGEILFDNKVRNEIPHQILNNSIAMVEQEIMLFGGTVKDNLTLWDNTIPEKNLRRACRDAAIEDVLDSLINGYQANLKEGATNLSGGQRQRLEIARALVNNPSILIFDEATSAMDAETEAIIYQNIQRRGCTCLIIAHRLSTIRDCDLIVVLDRGKVLQQGTHEELCLVDGLYSQLIKNIG